MRKVAVLAAIWAAFLLGGCGYVGGLFTKSDGTPMTFSEKVGKVEDYVATTCQLAIDNRVLVTMVSSANATALTATQIGYTICTAYLDAQNKSMNALVSPKCPNGEAFGVCIEGKPLGK